MQECKCNEHEQAERPEYERQPEGAGMVLEEWPLLQATRRFGRHSIPSRSSFLKLKTPGKIGSQKVAIL